MVFSLKLIIGDRCTNNYSYTHSFDEQELSESKLVRFRPNELVKQVVVFMIKKEDCETKNDAEINENQTLHYFYVNMDVIKTCEDLAYMDERNCMIICVKSQNEEKPTVNALYDPVEFVDTMYDISRNETEFFTLRLRRRNYRRSNEAKRVYIQVFINNLLYVYSSPQLYSHLPKGKFLFDLLKSQEFLNKKFYFYKMNRLL